MNVGRSPDLWLLLITLWEDALSVMRAERANLVISLDLDAFNLMGCAWPHNRLVSNWHLGGAETAQRPLQRSLWSGKTCAQSAPFKDNLLFVLTGSLVTHLQGYTMTQMIICLPFMFTVSQLIKEDSSHKTASIKPESPGATWVLTMQNICSSDHWTTTKPVSH